MGKQKGEMIDIIGKYVSAFFVAVVVYCAIMLAIVSCETGATHIFNQIVEEVTETDTLLTVPNGRPWQIVDSLNNELAELRVQLAECEGN